MPLEYRKPIANPLIVLREEFDDWAILFDPNSGNAFGLNPTGVFIWKHFDGKHTFEEILGELNGDFEDVPAEAKAHLEDFVQNLAERGFIGYETKKE